MKKKTLQTLSFALCASMVVTQAMPVMAQITVSENAVEEALIDTEQNMKESYGSLTYSISGTTLTISGSGAMTDAASPSQVPWYSSRENITNVVISSGVTTIGDYAFYNFENLTSITLPSSITKIGKKSFDDCSSLTSLTIPSSVKSIGEDAFYGCTSMKQYISNSSEFKSVDGVLFDKNQTKLIAYPAGSANSSYTVPNSVEEIGNSAFYKAAALSTITFPSTCTTFGYNSFDQTAWLTIEKNKSTDKIIIVNDCVVDANDSTGNITLPESIKKIAKGAFFFSSASKITFLNPECEIPDNTSDYDTIPDSITVEGLANSTAQEFAEKNNITFSSEGQNTFIKTAAFNVTVPKTGEKTTEAKAEAEGLTVKSITFSPATNYFGADTEYTVTITAEAKDDTYLLGESTTATVNGSDADETLEDGILTVSYKFPATESVSDAISYTIKHMKQSTDLENYELADTETGTGKIGTTVTVTPKNYTGFEPVEVESNVIGADGKTVIEQKYDRCKYTITYNANGGSHTNPAQYTYGIENLTLKNAVKDKYIFNGWYTSYDENTNTFSGKIEKISVTDTGNKTLYAKYSYDVAGTIKDNNGSTEGIFTKENNDFVIDSSITSEDDKKAVLDYILSTYPSAAIYKNVDGGLELMGIKVPSTSDSYEIPATIEGKKVVSVAENVDLSNASTLKHIIYDGEVVDYENFGAVYYIYKLNSDGTLTFITAMVDDETQTVDIPSSVNGKSVTIIGDGSTPIVKNPETGNLSNIKEVNIPSSVVDVKGSIPSEISNAVITAPEKVIDKIKPTHTNTVAILTGINLGNALTLTKGSTSQLNPVAVPASAKIGSLTYTSSNTAVATVNATGLVTAVNAGTANITVKSGNIQSVLTVTVKTESSSQQTPGSQTPEQQGSETEKADKNYYKVGSFQYQILDASKMTATLACPNKKTITKVTVPATVVINGKTYTVTEVKANAFKDCSKLKTVTVKGNVTKIGKQAFSGCVKLSKVSMGNKITEIGIKAFYGCKRLTTVKLSTGLTLIDEYAFGKCKALKKITIPSKVTKIGEGAFYKCTKLKTLKLGKSLKTIGAKSFYGCTALTKVTIPSKVTTIGSKAFYSCKNLKSVTMKSKKMTSIGSKAFKKCKKGIKFTVPKSKVKAYNMLLEGNY